MNDTKYYKKSVKASELIQEEKQTAKTEPWNVEDYRFVRCSTCKFTQMCPYSNADADGCGMRRELYRSVFNKTELKTEDPIFLNRLRILATYYVELMLLRSFGNRSDSDEILMLKATLGEFSNFQSDTKGLVKESKNSITVPWEASPEVIMMKKEIENARKLEGENANLRASLERLAREKKSEVDRTTTGDKTEN